MNVYVLCTVPSLPFLTVAFPFIPQAFVTLQAYVTP